MASLPLVVALSGACAGSSARPGETPTEGRSSGEDARMRCVPATEREEFGCFIVATEPLGRLPTGAVFWHLVRYPTRAAAEAARGPRSTVVESLGASWLFAIADAGWRPVGGRSLWPRSARFPSRLVWPIRRNTWKRSSDRE